MRLSSASTTNHGLLLAVGAREHPVLRFGVVDPPRARLQVDGAELPALAGVGEALLEAPLLLLVADREPVLHELDPFVLQRLLEQRAKAQELLVLVLRAEAHHALDAGAVVPAAVEEHDLPGGRELRGVTREVPLRPLALGGCGERGDAAGARVQVGGDALDHTVLARRVAPLEDNDEPTLPGDEPLLHVDELGLESQKLLLVLLAGQLAGLGHTAIFAHVPLRGHPPRSPRPRAA